MSLQSKTDVGRIDTVTREGRQWQYSKKGRQSDYVTRAGRHCHDTQKV